MLKALSDDVDVAGNAQLALQYFARRGNWF